MLNAGILGMGSFIPEKIVTNADLEKIVDTSDEWIRSRTGIEERRFAGDDLDTVEMSYLSSKEALKQAGIQPEQLDLIIIATVTPNRPFPSVATSIQDKLGAHNAAAMDVNAACTGFMYGLVTAKQFIQTGDYKYVLVVGAEKISKILNFEDRNTAVIFGDGAGAAVLGPVSEGKGILAFDLGADGSGNEHITQKDKYLTMNGREVFKFAVRKMGQSALSVIHKAGLTKEDVDYLVPHQANIRIMEAARQRLDLPVEKMSKTVHKYGNTSAASIPMSLVDDLKNEKIKDGDIVVLVGFGAGLTWGSVAMRWGK